MMGLHGWVAGEIMVNLVVLALISYVIFRLRQRRIEAEPAIEANSLSIVKDIQQLQEDLEKNLSEKRTLTRKILTRLEHRLASAEELSRNLEGLLAQAEKLNPGASWLNDSTVDNRRATVMALGSKGISANEIASMLRLPLAEVTLMLKLQKDSRSAG
jgi:hypothetical protein